MLDWNVTLNTFELTFALVTSALIGGLAAAVLLGPRILKLRQQLCIDNLTQLYNSREFDRRLSLEVEKAINSHQPLSLVLMDVDHFKSVNDNYGYKAGDLILVKLSDVLKSTARQKDVVFRYKQGDEFAILMLRTDVSEALALTERLQEELGSYNFPFPASPGGDDFVELTVSAGIISLDTGADTFETFAERAEMVLRQAKQHAESGISVAPNLCETGGIQFGNGIATTPVGTNY